ncbi:DUF4123 domain-containing protein [Vibrio rumoiensis]|uniref:DUF4123 domain-containing protein n=1 Tax=Vibrio rumoiensis TaxID=76258 RepID=UPI003AA7F540
MSNPYLNASWCINAIEHSLLNRFPDGSNIYVLIESSLMPDWKVTLYQHINTFQLSEPYCETLFTGTHYQHLEHGPVLVNITDYPELQKAWLAQFEQTPLGCVLIAPATTNNQDIAALLRNRLTVYREANPTFLRYYEPRTMAAFIGALNEEERQYFYFPIQMMYWHHNQWLQAQWAKPEFPPKQLQSWKITPIQFNKMADIMKQIQSHEALT